MNFFNRRRNSNPSQEALLAAQAQLEQQQRENSDLRNQLEDLKEADDRNKSLLEHFKESCENSEAQIQELAAKQKSLDSQIAESERNIKQLREKKFEMMTDKRNEEAGSVQEILKLVETGEELLYFKDKQGEVWQIVKHN